MGMSSRITISFPHPSPTTQFPRIPRPKSLMAPTTYTPYGIFARAFYLATFLFFLSIQLPLWIWIELSPKRRPRRSWTFRRSVAVRLVRHCVNTIALPLGLGLHGYKRDPAKPAKKECEEAKHVVIPAFPAELIRGEVKKYVEDAGVEPIEVGGYWYGRRGGKGEAIPRPEPDEKVSCYASSSKDFVLTLTALIDCHALSRRCLHARLSESQRRSGGPHSRRPEEVRSID